jgi:hypothetical protein
MKKARIMLLAIAVMGIVGGTLAFTAKKYSSVVYVYGTTTTACSIILPHGTTTLTTPHISTVKFFYTTTLLTTPTTKTCTAFNYLTTTSL